MSQEGLDQDRDNADRLCQVVQDGCQAGNIALIFGQDPGSRFIDVLVAAADDLPDFSQCGAELELVHRGFDLVRQFTDQVDQLAVRVSGETVCRQTGWEILADHRRGAADEVAQVIGQVGVDPADQGFI